MPIFEQGYRAYRGPVRRGSRALAIAWESLRPRMTWWVWLFLVAFLLFSPYLLYGIVTFFVLFLGGAGNRLPSRGMPTEAILGPGLVRPDMFVVSVIQKSGAGFWDVLNREFMLSWPVALAAVTCAGILASDRRTGALQIYFARPVTRGDYLLGKILAVCGLCSLLTAIPCTILWVACAALHPEWAFVLETWWVPFSIVAASAVYCLWTAGLILLLSSILSRPVLIGTVAIFVHLLLLSMGEILAHTLKEKAWLAVIPHRAIGAVTGPLFGLSVPVSMPAWICAAVAYGFPALCFLVAARRLRAVEVVT